MKAFIAGFKRLIFNHPEGGAYVGLLVIFIVFSLSINHFFTFDSIISILSVASLSGIAALGITLLMISGEFDLSVGSIWGLSCVLVPYFMAMGVSAWISVIIVLIIGLCIGLLQGMIVVKIGIPSFIVTLAFLMGLRGIIFTGTGGSIVSLKVDTPFLRIFSYKLAYGINASSLWFIWLTAIFVLVLNRTRFGNWIFATGGNKLAAIQCGVPVDRVKLILFSLSAGLASFAGMIQITQFRIATYQYGDGTELTAITMAVIGGNLITGGYGSIVSTFLGAIILSIIQNGLILGQVSGYWFKAVVGILLLFTVIVNTIIQRRAFFAHR